MSVIDERIENFRCPLCDKDLNETKQGKLSVNWESYKGKRVPLCSTHPIPSTF